MRNISICGSQLQHIMPPPSFVQTLQMDGVEVHCGVIHTDDVKFDPQAVTNRSKVLVRKRAFSCNYRDKSFILKAAVKAPENRFYTVGSDFVAEVVACGKDVTQFQVGDRVIGNNCYPDSGVAGLQSGIPTNQASKEYQSFHQAKLLKIPAAVSDEVAATFSIGAQTAYSMIRKLNIQPGSNVLVTAAKSNTSLFVINALKQCNINLYATSTSLRFESKLKALGVKHLIQVDPNLDNWNTSEEIRAVFHETGGFDYIFDPFFDLHIGKVIPLFVPGKGGKYVTCGLYDQYSHLTGRAFEYHGLSLSQILSWMVFSNIQLIGNCLGNTQDLQQAIEDCAAGRFEVVVDSIFSGEQVKDFFERTYTASDRFGKVVYCYD
jgi:NADPH:quinone reductase-like Zn-dependent oxidoreductase